MTTRQVLTKDNAEEAIRRIGGIPIRTNKTNGLRGLFMGLYAQGGAGKTLLAGSIAELGKSLYIDAEGGSEILDYREEEIDYVDAFNYKTFQSVVAGLVREYDSGEHPYDNIIVDNLSELLDLCEDFMGIVGNDSHDLQRYNLVKKEFLKRIRQLRDIARKYPVNIILLLWDADERDERKVLKKDLALTPKLREKFPGIVNIIGHISAVPGKPDLRELSFEPSPKSVSKFRRSPTSSAMEVPYVIQYTYDNLPLPDIIRAIKGEAKWPKNKYVTPSKQSTSASKSKENSNNASDSDE